MYFSVDSIIYSYGDNPKGHNLHLPIIQFSITEKKIFVILEDRLNVYNRHYQLLDEIPGTFQIICGDYYYDGTILTSYSYGYSKSIPNIVAIKEQDSMLYLTMNDDTLFVYDKTLTKLDGPIDVLPNSIVLPVDDESAMVTLDDVYLSDWDLDDNSLLAARINIVDVVFSNFYYIADTNNIYRFHRGYKRLYTTTNTIKALTVSNDQLFYVIETDDLNVSRIKVFDKYFNSQGSEVVINPLDIYCHSDFIWVLTREFLHKMNPDLSPVKTQPVTLMDSLFVDDSGPYMSSSAKGRIVGPDGTILKDSIVGVTDIKMVNGKLYYTRNGILYGESVFRGEANGFVSYSAKLDTYGDSNISSS